MSIRDCPCASGVGYAACCGRFHAGAAAETAEQLMRSRFSAYTLKLDDYVLATWHSSTRPVSLDLAHDQVKWLALQVIRHAPENDRAIVEFVARYRVGGRGARMHETSRFVREAGFWYYVDGEVS